MSDPVPAIAEAAATGEIATIFADIRRVLGVDVVNLIWRHLATLQGALPWAWGTLRPLYAGGMIAGHAAGLREDLDLPQILPFPPEALAAAGLGDADMVAIRNVLAAYNRTNAMALIALSALLRRLDGAPAPDGEAPPISVVLGDSQTAIPLPPLPTLTELPPAVAQLVLTLNRLGTRRDQPVLASMYRHLAYWPPYLALAWTLVAPLDSDARLARAIADATAQARMRAARLASRLFHVPPLPAGGDADAAIRAAIEPFTSDVIARMVVICAVLRAATGG